MPGGRLSDRGGHKPPPGEVRFTAETKKIGNCIHLWAVPKEPHPNLLSTLCAQGKTILYSSHLVEVVEKLCQRLAVIDHGNLIADASSPQWHDPLDRWKVHFLRQAGHISGPGKDGNRVAEFFGRVQAVLQRVVRSAVDRHQAAVLEKRRQFQRILHRRGHIPCAKDDERRNVGLKVLSEFLAEVDLPDRAPGLVLPAERAKDPDRRIGFQPGSALRARASRSEDSDAAAGSSTGPPAVPEEASLYVALDSRRHRRGMRHRFKSSCRRPGAGQLPTSANGKSRGKGS